MGARLVKFVRFSCWNILELAQETRTMKGTFEDAL